ncbi:MAG: T9SS type A sorting domain-containing protein [Bacteroidetes bacterium]|nr:T9SS type A sorting domain-containing protein [Bacteroidota bacterium]
MKIKLTSILIALVCCQTIIAQCVNGTHTDPTASLTPANGGATPANNTFKQNTFDWRGSSQIIASDAAAYTSPFYSAVNPSFFSNQSFSDYNPSDGWELIKQDFGYFYKNGMWNGGTRASDPLSPSPGAGFNLPYYVLYNKFTSVLRVFAFLNNKTVALNSINIKLRLLTSADYPNATYTTSSNPTEIYYQPNINALFNNYNVTCTALDKNTTITEVEAPAIFPVNNTSSDHEFIHADFHLSYDPCICLFQSGFEVSFYTIQTANLTLTGKYAGVGGMDVASVSSSTATLPPGAINGSGGSGNNADFIASVFNNGGSPQSAIQNYLNAQQTYNYSQDNTTSQVLGMLSNFFSATSGASAIVDPSGETKDVLDGISKVLSFFSGDLSSAQATPPVAVTVESGYLQATGQIVAPKETYPGVNAKIGVPSSLPPPTYTSLPEYSGPVQGAILPNYPMYNEPVGIFTLLKTPVITRFTATSINTNTNAPLVNTILHTKEVFKTAPLIYKLNPIIDQSNSKIYTTTEFVGSYYDLKNLILPMHANGIIYNNDVKLVGFNALYDTTIIKSHTIVPNSFTLGKSNILLRTDPFPIDCSGQNYASIVSTYSAFAFGSTPDTNNYFFRVVLMMDLVTYPDQYGKRHRIMRVEKYAADVVDTSADFSQTSPGKDVLYALATASTNLVLVQNTYTNAVCAAAIDTFSFGKMKINGNQYSPASTGTCIPSVNIIAEKEIDVQGEVVINSEFDLKIQSLPSVFNGCNNPTPTLTMSPSDLSSYCKGGTYQGATYAANQQSSRLIAMNNKKKNSEAQNAASTSNFKTKNTSSFSVGNSEYKIGIYPNPTQGKVSVNVFSPTQQNAVQLSIEDLTGKIVFMQTLDLNAGLSHNELNLLDLVNGVYFVKLNDNQGKLIKADKLMLSR